jgi:hypothetical protein
MKYLAKGEGGYVGFDTTYFYVSFINEKGRKDTKKFKTIEERQNFIAKEIARAESEASPKGQGK